MVEMFIIQRLTPIRVMLRVWAENKLLPISSSRPKGLVRKLCYLGCHMRWASVKVQPYYKVLGPAFMKLSDPIGPIFRVGANPHFSPKYKVGIRVVLHKWPKGCEKRKWFRTSHGYCRQSEDHDQENPNHFLQVFITQHNGKWNYNDFPSNATPSTNIYN
jgi:hypothetical protein